MKRRDLLKILGVISAAVVAPQATALSNIQLYPPTDEIKPREGLIWLPARLTFEPYAGDSQTVKLDIPVSMEMDFCGIVFRSGYDFRVEAMQDLKILAFEVDIGPAIRIVDPNFGAGEHWGKLYGREQDVLQGHAIFIQYKDPIISCEEP